MPRSLIVGLGRSGGGLHLPVLLGLRTQDIAHELFADAPIVTVAPAVGADTLPPGELSPQRSYQQ